MVISVSLTPASVTIWRSLSGGKDLDGITPALTEEFDSIPEDITEDIWEKQM